MFTIESKQQPNPHSLKILQHSINPNQQILYCHSKNDQLTLLCTNDRNQLIVRQCSIQTKVEVAVQYANQLKQKSKQQILYAFVEGCDGFVLFREPFQVYFFSKYSQSAIKLTLSQQPLYFQHSIIDINYPTATLFCRKKSSQKNQILELNFQTLQLKTINDGKNYSPKAKSQLASLILDGRIYVFGGKDEKGKECDQVIWVYDIEKGYWFALEMLYPAGQDFSLYKFIPVSNSKVLFVNITNNKTWVLQIHQSRLTQLSNQFPYKQNTIIVKDQIVNFQNNKWNLWKKKLVFHKADKNVKK